MKCNVCFSPCVLAGVYDQAEVAGAAFRQPVDFMDEVVYKDAVGHDGLTVAGTAEAGSRIRRCFFLPFIGCAFLLLVTADPGGMETPCLVRYVYLFFRMVLLFRVPGRLRLPDVREDEEGVIAGHRHEKDENDLSVLHGYMALDNGVLFSGKGRKVSPSLAALASSRAFLHVSQVKYSMFRCTPVT